MHEKTIGIMERLLGKSTEMNFELAEILEEIDETVEEYKKNNDNIKKKLWEALRQIRDKDSKLVEFEEAIKIISDKNDELNEKLQEQQKDFNELKEKYKEEKMKNFLRDKQSKRSSIYHNRKGRKNFKKCTYG